MAIRAQSRRVNVAQIEETNQNPNRKNRKIIGYQIWKHISTFDENQMLKNTDFHSTF